MSILVSAANVLRVYSSERSEVTVTDVCALLGLPKSNASRLLRAMRDVGLLETVGASKRYRPAVLLHEVGRVYRTASPLLQRADDVVRRVAGESGHTGYVSRLDGRQIVAITDHPATRPLRVASSIGRRLHAEASATGRSLLARLPDADVRRLYAEGLDIPSASAPQSIEDLLARLAVVRREGFAESSDESIRGVGALGVAVGDPETGDSVSLCIAYPVSSITTEERRTVTRALVEGAQAIARVVGDPLFPTDPAVLKA